MARGRSFAWWSQHGARVAAHAHDQWVNEQLQLAPHKWRRRLAREHARRMTDDEVAGNTWLREVTASMRGLLLPLHASDADLRERADGLALECVGLADAFSGMVPMYEACKRFCEVRGIEPPKVENGEVWEIRAAVKRMTCPHWWRRRLRKQHGRLIEGGAIRLQYVHKRSECYVSDENATRRAEQKRRNAAAMEAQELENQHGQVFTLAELAARSVSNPAIRRGELMTRLAGFDLLARELGHVADFWTLTCPSRFHAVRAADCRPNPAHDGSTPREAHAHLSRCWAKFRAWAARLGVWWYGFRVAEPHHDGCPHWHVIAFLKDDEARQTAREGLRRYFLDQHDASEPGADVARVKFKTVELSATSSAAGYLAKYISKNIDGYQVQTDLYGNDAVTGAARVEAWAATWGIRQFQAVGGPPVGVWRELRRLKPSSLLTDTVERARQAADVNSEDGAGVVAGGWAEYVRIQGGPIVRRDDLAIRAAVSREGYAYDPVEQKQVGGQVNQYGEACKGVVWGVRDMHDGLSFASRLHKWERRGAGGVNTVEAAGVFGRGRVFRAFRGRVFGESLAFRECEGSATAVQEIEEEFQVGLQGGYLASAKRAQPWSPVNNCTRGGAIEGCGNSRLHDRALQGDGGSVGEAGVSDHAGCVSSAVGALGNFETQFYGDGLSDEQIERYQRLAGYAARAGEVERRGSGDFTGPDRAGSDVLRWPDWGIGGAAGAAS